MEEDLQFVITINISNQRTPFKHWKKNIRSINPQSFSTLLVLFKNKATRRLSKHFSNDFRKILSKVIKPLRLPGSRIGLKISHQILNQ